MFNIGDKLTEENYTAGAIWCNENNCTINSNWVIEAIPEPTVEELQAQVRAVRNSYLKEYVDDKAKSPFMWEEVPEEEKALIGEYRKYLMDYTKEENWYLQNPKTFEEWKNSAKSVEESNSSDSVLS